MAYIEVRQLPDGEVSHAVRWRARGARSGRRESEVFTGPDTAERFMDLVNGFGQQWPPGRMREQGFVVDLRSPEEMFEPFAMRQIGLFTGIQGDMWAKYRRMVEQNAVPWLPTLPGQPVLEFRGNGHRVSMNGAEINHLPLELVDLPTWARGMGRVLAKGTAGWRLWPVFTNEDWTWI